MKVALDLHPASCLIPTYTSTSASLHSAQPYPIFISFRVAEAKSQALALKAALEARGYRAFCSEVDIPRGADW